MSNPYFPYEMAFQYLRAQRGTHRLQNPMELAFLGIVCFSLGDSSVLPGGRRRIVVRKAAAGPCRVGLSPRAKMTFWFFLYSLRSLWSSEWLWSFLPNCSSANVVSSWGNSEVDGFRKSPWSWEACLSLNPDFLPCVVLSCLLCLYVSWVLICNLYNSLSLVGCENEAGNMRKVLPKGPDSWNCEL